MLRKTQKSIYEYTKTEGKCDDYAEHTQNENKTKKILLWKLENFFVRVFPLGEQFLKEFPDAEWDLAASER